MSSKDFIVFGEPQIETAEIEEVVATMESHWLGTGPKVAQFESDFADYRNIDKSKVAALNSGTAALHLALLASGVGKGDEVIVPAMTFCATINAVIHAGATPVLADVDPKSMNLNPADVERHISPRTRAILPVHFAGRPCDMDALMDIARQYDLKVIEDCAHAIETEYKGQKVGTFGDFGCFSFYVTKNLTTGEGGMLIAKRDEDVARIKMLALHGMSKDAWHRFGDDGYKHYQVIGAGFKYNMMDLQAAIGIHQLKRIDDNLEKRAKVWSAYQTAFADLDITLPDSGDKTMRHAYHLYTILIDEKKTKISRDEFLTQMTKAGIGVGVHYTSIAEHPYYKKNFGFKTDDYPISKRIGEQTVSIPLSASLSDSDTLRIIASVRKIIKEPSTTITTTHDTEKTLIIA